MALGGKQTGVLGGELPAQPSTAATTDLGERCECGCVRMSCISGDFLRCADCGRVWPGVIDADALADLSYDRETISGG